MFASCTENVFFIKQTVEQAEHTEPLFVLRKWLAAGRVDVVTCSVNGSFHVMRKDGEDSKS